MKNITTLFKRHKGQFLSKSYFHKVEVNLVATPELIHDKIDNLS
jgi:hypothetical protein